MAITTDRQDPRLAQTDPETGLQSAYVVISDEELAKGYHTPERKANVHIYKLDGSPVPTVLLNEHVRQSGGCGALTTMATAIAETFASDPKYYSATYCTGCRTHLPVGEFHWDGSSERVGS